MEHEGRYSLINFLLRGYESEQSGGIAGHNGIRQHVFDHNTAGADHRIFPNDDTGQHRGARANGGASLDDGWFHFPIRLSLELSYRIGGARVGVVDESHTVTDEHAVLDPYTFANERVAGYLAASSHAGVLLDFDEGADFCVVTNLATIQVDKAGKLNVVAKPDVGSNAQEVVVHARVTASIRFEGMAWFSSTASALFRMD